MLDIQPLAQKYVPTDLKINTWDDLAPYVQELLDRPLNSLSEYERFLEDESEFDCVISEEFIWRHVRMTCDTADKELEAHFNDYLQNISPKLEEYADAMNRKMVESPFADQVTEQGFSLALKGLRTQMELFRTDNIALGIANQELANESAKIRGGMTVMLDGEELTVPKAGDRLYWLDRARREEAWRAIGQRAYQDHEKLDEIFTQQIGLRTKIAQNAGFDNFRDYQFKNDKRYDYGPKECYDFHAAIEQHIVPLTTEFMQHRAALMGLEKLRPWDGSVDPKGLPPLKAFADADDLIEKSGRAFAAMDPVFEGTFSLMRDMKRMDLASRPNKRPGGYMTGLPVSKVPFIFANVTEKVRDLITLIHEVGHATHDVLMRHLRLNSYARYPMEVAELASMSMELISFDQWHLFFPDEADLRRAKRGHLEQIIGLFPWIAQIDAFQHEVYLKPDLSAQDRHKLWAWIQQRYATGMVDWEGFAAWHETSWQRQGHVFEAPFYYIEYGIAQLGALQVWRNYKQDPKQALQQYKNALSLGYTRSVPEIYETAGVKFDFSSETLKDLMAFVQQEMKDLQD